MKRPKDTIAQTTRCKESTGSGNKKRKGEAEASSYDYDLSEVEALFSDGGGIASEAGFAERSQSESRNAAHIRNRANITDDQITDPPMAWIRVKLLGATAALPTLGTMVATEFFLSSANGDGDDGNNRSSTPTGMKNHLHLYLYLCNRG